MTKNKGERITGLVIEQVGRHTFRVVVHDDGFTDETLVFTGVTENRALYDLVEAVYRVRCERAMELAGWKCSQCGTTNNLQCHHKVFRSHGRDDRLSNLRVLCAERCHAAEH